MVDERSCRAWLDQHVVLSSHSGKYAVAPIVGHYTVTILLLQLHHICGIHFPTVLTFASFALSFTLFLVALLSSGSLPVGDPYLSMHSGTEPSDD